jgi:hypothetical protein
VYYFGHRAAEVITYRWKKPFSFVSLKKQNANQLRGDLLTLQAMEYSQVREDTPSDLQKAADYLGEIRNGKSPELTALLDLQIATDYVEMARLERDIGNTALADHHRQMADGILHSLGWQDVSDETTAKLTRWQLWWKRAK